VTTSDTHVLVGSSLGVEAVTNAAGNAVVDVDVDVAVNVDVSTDVDVDVDVNADGTAVAATGDGERRTGGAKDGRTGVNNAPGTAAPTGTPTAGDNNGLGIGTMVDEPLAVPFAFGVAFPLACPAAAVATGGGAIVEAPLPLTVSAARWCCSRRRSLSVSPVARGDSAVGTPLAQYGTLPETPPGVPSTATGDVLGARWCDIAMDVSMSAPTLASPWPPLTISNGRGAVRGFVSTGYRCGSCSIGCGTGMTPLTPPPTPPAAVTATAAALGMASPGPGTVTTSADCPETPACATAAAVPAPAAVPAAAPVCPPGVAAARYSLMA
jgi:hypothetical protein